MKAVKTVFHLTHKFILQNLQHFELIPNFRQNQAYLMYSFLAEFVTYQGLLYLFIFLGHHLSHDNMSLVEKDIYKYCIHTVLGHLYTSL